MGDWGLGIGHGYVHGTVSVLMTNIDIGSLAKKDVELRSDDAPVWITDCPFFGGFADDEEDEFEQGCFGGKSAFSFGYFSDSAVEAFNEVSGVHDFSDRLGVLKESAEPLPVIAPGFDDRRVFITPINLEAVQFALG